MAVAFGNTINVDYNSANVSSTANADVTKPSAWVDGTLCIYLQAINDQTAGSFTSTAGALTVVTGPTNAPTFFQAGAQRRAGASADSPPIGCNNSNGANAQKTGMILVFTGHDVANPIRAVGTTGTGTSTTPTCPNTSAATSGDMVLRVAWWRDDGDTLGVTRTGGGFSAGPLFNGVGANCVGVVADFLSSAGGAPGSGNFTLTASRPWVADSIVIAASAGGGGVRLIGGALVGGILLGSLAS